MPSQAKRQRKKEGQRARQEAIRLAQARAARRRRYILIGGAVVAVLLIAFLSSRSGSKKKTSVSTKGKTTTTVAPAAGGAATAANSSTKCPAADGSSPKTTHWTTAPPACISLKKKYTATFDTTEGKVVVALDTTKTPKTTNNFVVLSRYHFYDGTPIFRTDTSIDIIQGGGASPSDPGHHLDQEGNLKYATGHPVFSRPDHPNSNKTGGFFPPGAEPFPLGLVGQFLFMFGRVLTGVEVVMKIIVPPNEEPPGVGLAGPPPVTVNTNTITETRPPGFATEGDRLFHQRQ